MSKVKYDKQTGAVIPKDNYDLKDCSFDELVQLCMYYYNMASSTFHCDEEPEDRHYTDLEARSIVIYWINVADRYSKELKNRAILSTI